MACYPSNIARKPKITSGPSFFGADVGIIADGVDVMAAFKEDLFDESKQKQRRTKGCGRKM